ncbi:DNA repair protein RecO [Herbivorax sp. ANBcel31]|uniref:DNA repair protein RecO n=1 Tax=Herbivorax sp. ANBcel31 TaxID=3069754 RepID=UPI0027B28751|nr:DNA repair protein RecO [Herbivorax sp. ANBcel31]MDQ2085987.1 DNA repair protein RecO [Herbivorax sp. ANBcel31]
MSYVKTTGIVIKEVHTGEANKIVTLFTRNMGKVSGSAKGARRPKSRFVAGTQLLCYSDFVLFKGKEMYSINSCDVIEPFYNIRNSIEKLTCAAHMTEIINDIVQENQQATKLLKLFLNSLHMLSNSNRPILQILTIFEMKLLSILGYAPWVGGCLNCENKEFGDMLFSFEKCGFICEKCASLDKGAVQLSEGATKAIYYIVCSNMKNIFNFEVSNRVLNELRRVSKTYLNNQLEKNYKKMDFLKYL